MSGSYGILRFTQENAPGKTRKRGLSRAHSEGAGLVPRNAKHKEGYAVSKFRLTVVTLFAMGLMVSLSSTTASAAVNNPNADQVAKARAANYCSDPWITWGIWWVTASTRN